MLIFLKMSCLLRRVFLALYVDGISEVKNGAWPCMLPGVYEADNEEIKKYSLAAKTKSSFDEYMKFFLNS
jgi:hypothetical protein